MTDYEKAVYLWEEKNRLQKEIDTLQCNTIECHMGRDILDSVWEAIHRLPPCGLSAILCGAAQEIDALRGIVKEQDDKLEYLESK